MHHLISINASPTQIRKLRKGHHVRVKKGTGFNVLVHPLTYRLATKAFGNNKGIQLRLSPEEITANHNASMEDFEEAKNRTANETGTMPELVGQGIFGSKFDSFLAKTGLNKITDALAPIAKPIIKTGIDLGTKTLGATLGKFVPHGDKIAERLGNLANNYIDDPSRYNDQGNKGWLEAGKTLVTGNGVRHRHRKPKRGGSVNPLKYVEHGKAKSYITGQGYMQNAGLGYAKANQENAELEKQHVEARHKLNPSSYKHFSHEPFAPFSRGYGLYAGRMGMGIVGHNGGMLTQLPPALQSQPYSANYQMSHFLPVQYQHFNNSMHMSEGHGLSL